MAFASLLFEVKQSKSVFLYSPRKKGKYILEYISALEVFEKQVGYPVVYVSTRCKLVRFEMLLISK